MHPAFEQRPSPGEPPVFPPVGRLLGRYAYQPAPGAADRRDPGDGSCMIVVATDAAVPGEVVLSADQ